MTATALARTPGIHRLYDGFDPPSAQLVVGTSPQLERATDLLLCGSHRLCQLASEGSLAEPWPTDAAGGVRARYVANCLRELDTFLKGVLEEVAPIRAGQPREHNAANHLERLSSATTPAPTLITLRMPGVASDADRLRALARSRACLWHCHGLVRRADRPEVAWMSAGWYASGSTRLRRYAIGEQMAPDGAELAGVAAFYHDLAGRIARR